MNIKGGTWSSMLILINEKIIDNDDLDHICYSMNSSQQHAPFNIGLPAANKPKKEKRSRPDTIFFLLA
jgi:hypothetical protein